MTARSHRPYLPRTLTTLGVVAADGVAVFLRPAYTPLIAVVTALIAIRVAIVGTRPADPTSRQVQTAWTLAQKGLRDAEELARISGLQPDLARQVMHDAVNSSSPTPPPARSAGSEPSSGSGQ
jgi:hypothetical protein